MALNLKRKREHLHQHHRPPVALVVHVVESHSTFVTVVVIITTIIIPQVFSDADTDEDDDGYDDFDIAATDGESVAYVAIECRHSSRLGSC